MPADGIGAAAIKQDFGTSHWPLADKLNVRAGSVHRYLCCRKGSGAQNMGVMPAIVATDVMAAIAHRSIRRDAPFWSLTEQSGQRVAQGLHR
jgi:hypothetical protein